MIWQKKKKNNTIPNHYVTRLINISISFLGKGSYGFCIKMKEGSFLLWYGGYLPSKLQTIIYFDSELYGVTKRLLKLLFWNQINPHQKYTVFIDYMSVIQIIETHYTTNTIPYNQKGYDLVKQLIKHNHNEEEHNV